MGILDTVTSMNKKAVILKQPVGSVTDAMVKNTEFMKQQSDKSILPPVPETSKVNPKSKGLYEMFADNIAAGMKQAVEVIPSAPFKQFTKSIGDIQNDMAKNIDSTTKYLENTKTLVPEPSKGQISMVSKFNAQTTGKSNIKGIMGIGDTVSIHKPVDGEIRKTQYVDATSLGEKNLNNGVLESSRKAHTIIPEPKNGEIRKRQYTDANVLGKKNLDNGVLESSSKLYQSYPHEMCQQLHNTLQCNFV